jgi:hypothetical protein
MKKLYELFDVSYGNKFDLNKMRLSHVSKGGVHFVGRSSTNHGVSAVVAPLRDTRPFEAGLITVALGGTKVLSSFVQDTPFYTAQNVAILRPRGTVSFAEKLYMCLCIRHNRFRYSAFGREANRTLKDLLVPEPKEFPSWARGNVTGTDKLSASSTGQPTIPLLDTAKWKCFELSKLFDIKKGKRLTKARMTKGNTPFIGAIDNNNGLTGFVGQSAIHDAETISVNYNGNGVAEAFYQPKAFWCSDDVNVLYPKFPLTPAIALFITTVIRLERFRFNYGRKWHLERMETAVIRLPADLDGNPDWHYMKAYVESLPYSSQIV